MNSTGRGVLTSQEHALRTRTVSGTYVRPGSTRCARAAAIASAVLGATLLLRLPHLVDSAFYVAVLAAAAAVISVVSGAVLWDRDSLVVRAVAGLAAAAVLTADLFAVVVGLPGARDVADLSAAANALHLVLPVVVLALLTVDARRREPEQAPDHPYAL